MLYDNQKTIARDIYENITNKELFNIPTGRGKTYILADVAKELAKKGKKVIISTPNNNLVRDMFKVVKHTTAEHDFKSNIVIGKDNYVCRAALKECENEFSNIEEYVTKDSFMDYVSFSKKQKDLFVEDMNEILVYKDIAYASILRDLLSPKEDYIRMNTDLDIIVTNHFYLLSKVSYDKNFKISEYAILIDEVHELTEVAENIYTNNFSTFEFKNKLASFVKEIKDDEKKTMSYKKQLKTLLKKATNLHNKFICYEQTGNYEDNVEKVRLFSNEIKDLLTSKEYTYITKHTKREEASFSIDEHKRVLKHINNYDSFNSGIFYTPSRGYATLKTSNGSALGFLNKSFWGKIKLFAGVSASVTSSFTPDQYEKKYAYQRLGMLEKDRKEYNIRFYDRLFSKDKVNIFLPNESSPDAVNIYDEDIKLSDSYYNYLADYIKSTHNHKNSMVLCGGYKEAEFLSKIYREADKDSNIVVANPKERTTATVDRFRREGGVLFAVRNYNMGISLEREELENLYIVKFPFPDMSKKKWLELRKESQGKYQVDYRREMLIALMQTLGRLQRTKEDRGSIHVIDKRYFLFNSKLRANIDEIFNNYGTVNQETKLKSPKLKDVHKENVEFNLEDIL